MEVADAVVAALIAMDVRYVFGVSGANIEHLHDAIHRCDGKLRSVLAKSEAGAAFMADARARVHRTLGVCCSTSGGGMVNLVPGIAEAFMESVPLLALVGQPPARLEGRGGFQDSSGVGRSVDALALFRSVSKFTAKIVTPEDFWPCLSIAISTALSGRQGPSVLLVPRSMWDLEVAPLPADFADRVRRRVEQPTVPPEMVDEVLETIRDAKRPVLVMGHGVRRSSDPDAVREFANVTGIPVVTTMSARAEFPNDDPAHLGVVGVAGHPSAHDYLRGEADLLIVVGAGLNAMTRAPFASDPKSPLSKPTIAVNIDPGEILRVSPPASSDGSPGSTDIALERVVRADAGAFFRALLVAWKERPFRVAAAPELARRVFVPTLAAAIPAHPIDEGRTLSPLRSSEALAELQRVLTEFDHLLFDAGNCAASALHFLTLPRGISATIALGMGGMGYAIAGAVGVQLGGASDTRTLVIAGDGSFLITGTEIHTAVDLGLPILFVVFNNAMHGMCVTRQQVYFDSRLECARYSPFSAAEVARGFGTPDRLWTGTAHTRAEVATLLDDYLRSGKPRTGVLDLRLDSEELPPFTPLIAKDAQTVASWGLDDS